MSRSAASGRLQQRRVKLPASPELGIIIRILHGSEGIIFQIPKARSASAARIMKNNPRGHCAISCHTFRVISSAA